MQRLPLQVLVFLSLLTFIASGVGLVLSWRLVGVLALPAPWTAVGNLVVLGWLGLLLGGMILPRVLGKGPGTNALAWAGYLALGLLGVVLPLIALRDVAFVAWDFLSGAAALAGAAPAGDADPSAMRAATAGLLGLSLGLVGWGVRQARRTPAVRTVQVPIRDLPAGLQGLRIVQLSDVHVGPTIERDFLEPVVERVNALQPDLVAITGDLVDGSVADLRPHTAVLGRIEAPLGKWFVTGNHEYYAGAEAWVGEMLRLGFGVLLNEHVVLEKDGAQLVLAGVTDHDAGRILPGHRSDPRSALQGAPRGLPRVLLAHQPRTALQAQGLGIDLQLSGHTHGGQLWPWMHLVWLQQPLTAGLGRVGDVPVYTSRGTGTWGPPVRIGAPSEITLVELVRAD